MLSGIRPAVLVDYAYIDAADLLHLLTQLALEAPSAFHSALKLVIGDYQARA